LTGRSGRPYTLDPMDAQSAGGAARRQDSGSLSAGATIAGRYQIGRLVRTDPFGEVYEVTGAGQQPYTIHLLAPALTGDAAVLAQVAEDVRRAAGVQHTSIAQVIELGKEGGRTFLVTELVEGHSLRELLARKKDTGQAGFGAKGAANIALHVCGALTAVHEAIVHGAVSLETIVVSRSGRIKLAALGLASLAPLAARHAGARVSPAVAPEVIAGGRPSAAADVYGLGAVLYEILVGSPPVKGCQRPSQAVPGLPASIDQIIARCMVAAPQNRPRTIAEVREAIAAALSDRTVASAAQPGGAQPRQAASLAESLSARPSAQQAAAAPVVAAVGDGDERWLISKGKLDFGPFTQAALMDQIRASQIVPGNVVIDKDTGDRRPIEDHPLFSELVEATRLKRDEERRAQAEVVHAKEEKRRGATLYVFILLAVVGLGGGAYLLYGKLTAHKDDGNKGAISGLASGSVEATLSFPTKAERTARRSGKKSGGGGAGGVAGGWNDTVDLDMDEEGGDERLDDSQVNPVLQRSGGALGRCLMSTGTRNANVEFIVQGSGKVSQVRVNGETGSPAANCVRGVMKSTQFPSFNGKRSKHYFDMAY
jgi:hypothetical protein